MAVQRAKAAEINEAERERLSRNLESLREVRAALKETSGQMRKDVQRKDLENPLSSEVESRSDVLRPLPPSKPLEGLGS